jgi:hypothetical protein
MAATVIAYATVQECAWNTAFLSVQCTWGLALASMYAVSMAMPEGLVFGTLSSCTCSLKAPLEGDVAQHGVSYRACDLPVDAITWPVAAAFNGAPL